MLLLGSFSDTIVVLLALFCIYLVGYGCPIFMFMLIVIVGFIGLRILIK